MKHIIFFLIVTVLSLSACGQKDKSQEIAKTPKSNKELSKYQVAYFGSGCFWCVEAIYESVKGVAEVESGYAGGHVENPTYEDVCTGTTGHAETVKIYYDSSIVSYDELLKVFYDSHDPTTLNRQGPDAGTQYRSAIFYQNDFERDHAKTYIQKLLLEKKFPSITTEVVKYTAFYKAEEYHQNFECRNPNNGYVQAVSQPRLEQFKIKAPEMLKTEEKKK
ncbi:MAG: Peptide methionine sulfoxide reductase msrA [Fluviicola sp.]|jgi:peptide-methionine (S)-S-oxide reductase|uniref:peptide-methionine (S)-S-oxide reductase MsrA n=1 Tax=Fluviicola sp. TaxID=1917219 RepID=UPI00262A5C5A|nr:peptide-methionine (S)-S-oxide reductase MsrA [Fluviicola sp.]MDF3027841.1 Peptide methionine sulfoxide reductase msrA [Fluviicola sp.]